jgi:hypothetical protein
MSATLASVVSLVTKIEETMSQLVVLLPKPSNVLLPHFFLGNQSLETAVDLLDLFD